MMPSNHLILCRPPLLLPSIFPNELALPIRWPKYWSFSYSSVQFSRSVMANSLQPHELQHARLPCPSPTRRVYPNMSTESVMPSNHLIFYHPLLLLPSFFLSIRVFSNESVLRIRWPEYWSFSFSISPSNEYSGLISFRIDWLDLLAFQGTCKSFLQHHSSKASILQCSAVFIVQLSHPYMITGKTIALTRWTFAGKVMSLLSNLLSRLVIAFLPRNLMSLNFMSAVTICNDFGAQKTKVCHCFMFPHLFAIKRWDWMPWS